MIFGVPDGLHAELTWLPCPDGALPGVVSRTWGALKLWVDAETCVWGSDGDPVEWNWNDLLAFLADAWAALVFEEQRPFSGLDEIVLGNLRDQIEQRWTTFDNEADIDQQDERLRAFECRHDLARALRGAEVPSLLLLRSGNQMIVGSGLREWRQPVDDVLSCLEGLAGHIRSRLATMAEASPLIAAWDSRKERCAQEGFRLASGLDEARLKRIWPAKNQNLPRPANTNLPELAVAARMMDGVLKDSDIGRLLAELGKLHPTRTQGLDTHADLCRIHSGLLSESEPRAQGERGAVWLRRHRQMADASRFDPAQFLTEHSVEIIERKLGTRKIDAVAVWGPSHGPAVIVNTEGQRSSQPAGRNFSLAHEIGHLLMDRRQGLPVAEVLIGKKWTRVDRRLETRANAFAAELLAPKAAVNRMFCECFSDHSVLETSLDSWMSRVAEHFQASYELIAWQLNKLDLLRGDDRLLIRKYTRSLGSL
ncbi:putative DNA-binding protein [Magnetospirillum sp. LM-5]|uniref:ImmA/IrrE family metallo-endopeptidase n=1 Tax=Magnetospirillum sp. LM-5 TaxID=2681466 RepID=UPI00138171B5|nr:ImmA/IrrE family metallo-endopeptidase [Magnetospirillum sp. LM-5]CAA7618408.1 putative DNA-binding protein [Magnetospirillum sp. LM-5]